MKQEQKENLRRMLEQKGMTIEEIQAELNPPGTSESEYVPMGVVEKVLLDLGATRDGDGWALPRKAFAQREAERRALVDQLGALLEVLYGGEAKSLSRQGTDAERALVSSGWGNAADVDGVEVIVPVRFAEGQNVLAVWARKIADGCIPPTEPDPDEVRIIVERRAAWIEELQGGPGTAEQLCEAVWGAAVGDAEIAVCQADLEALVTAGVARKDDDGVFELPDGTQHRMRNLGRRAMADLTILASQSTGGIAVDPEWAEKEKAYQAEIAALRAGQSGGEKKDARRVFERRAWWTVKANDPMGRLALRGRIDEIQAIQRLKLERTEQQTEAAKKSGKARAELLQAAIAALESAKGGLGWEEVVSVYARLQGGDVVYYEAETDTFVARTPIQDAPPEHVAWAEREETKRKPMMKLEMAQPVIPSTDEKETSVEHDPDEPAAASETPPEAAPESVSAASNMGQKKPAAFGAAEARRAILATLDANPDGVAAERLADAVETTLRRAGRTEPLGPMQRELVGVVAKNAVKTGEVTTKQGADGDAYVHPKHAKSKPSASTANGLAERILEYLKTKPGQTKGQIVTGALAGASAGFDEAMGVLKKRGMVRQEGERRASRYTLA